jgi:bifunctional UDP-N-acetylglucosamine pyrophosphorylase/glucosamine-1-phosphate N-acetyltransferase
MESKEMQSTATLAVVIMAAGKGTRLKSRRPKVLHEIGGKPLLSHVIAAAGRVAPPEDTYAVVGHEADRVKSAVAATGIRFVDQPDQRGTGHAIQCARQAIAAYDNILVLSGDVPLIRPETIETLWLFHQKRRAAMTILTAFADDPTGYGRIIRTANGSPDVDAIVEQKALTLAQEDIHEVNSGIYVFRTAPLLAHLDQLHDSNANKEVILTDMAGSRNHRRGPRCQHHC